MMSRPRRCAIPSDNPVTEGRSRGWPAARRSSPAAPGCPARGTWPGRARGPRRRATRTARAGWPARAGVRSRAPLTFMYASRVSSPSTQRVCSRRRNSSCAQCRRPRASSSARSRSRRSGRCAVSVAAYSFIPVERGRSAQSARWNSLGSLRPRYFSTMLPRPSCFSPRNAAAICVSNRPEMRRCGVAVQDAHVVVRVVKDLLHGGVGEQRAQGCQVARRERVDQVVGRARGKLHQAHPVEEPVVARGFRVHTQQGLAAELLYQCRQPLGVLDVFVVHSHRRKRPGKIAGPRAWSQGSACPSSASAVPSGAAAPSPSPVPLRRRAFAPCLPRLRWRPWFRLAIVRSSWPTAACRTRTRLAFAPISPGPPRSASGCAAAALPARTGDGERGRRIGSHACRHLPPWRVRCSMRQRCYPSG